MLGIFLHHRTKAGESCLRLVNIFRNKSMLEEIVNRMISAAEFNVCMSSGPFYDSVTFYWCLISFILWLQFVLYILSDIERLVQCYYSSHSIRGGANAPFMWCCNIFLNICYGWYMISWTSRNGFYFPSSCFGWELEKNFTAPAFQPASQGQCEIQICLFVRFAWLPLWHCSITAFFSWIIFSIPCFILR